MVNGNGMGRIPVPWKNRWRHFRYSTLPVLGLLVLLASTFWLWNRAGEIPHAYGQVEVVRADVATALSGILTPLPRGAVGAVRHGRAGAGAGAARRPAAARGTGGAAGGAGPAGEGTGRRWARSWR